LLVRVSLLAAASYDSSVSGKRAIFTPKPQF
jgi:hypothetical protein